MIWFLRVLFLLVLASMLAVTSWASLHQPLGEFSRSATMRDPWVIATLCDAYWGFVAFFVWAGWKEQSVPARLLWFVNLIALGNIAIASFMLRELFAVSPRAALGEVLTRRQRGGLVLPGLLAAASVAIYFFA